ncbi:hypothetical protein KSB_48630 [Ktedonobacter robiniae]|uniref:Uncharacterized protein n=1 Tax=Ktedonobacter robiniae TaxID=2778365 RepID=A0ABQ3UUL3_9CHLR|nr:hypothetical protein KSB_48630 [Ktedonobacter robiniae]
MGRPLSSPFEHASIRLKTLHAYFLKHFDGTDIVIKTLSCDTPDGNMLEGPGYEALCHFRRIACPTIFGKNAVANLDHSLLIWPALKTDVIDDLLIGGMKNDAIPDRAFRIIFHELNEKW